MKDLPEVLKLHKMWLNGESGGAKANLSGADLIGSNLSEADLSKACFKYAIVNTAIHTTDYLISITGLTYPIWFTSKEEIHVGCMVFSYEEWLGKTDKEIADMDKDKDALEFYPTLIKVLTSIIKKRG